MSTIWNTEQEKDREKKKVGGRPSKLNEKKNKKEKFVCRKSNMKTL